MPAPRAVLPQSPTVCVWLGFDSRFPVNAQVSLPVYPALESPERRWTLRRHRGDAEEGWGPAGLGPTGERTKWVALSGEQREGEWGVRTRVERSGVVGSKGKGVRECALDSLRNLEVPSGVRGAKGQGSATFDPDPSFSKHPSAADLWAAEEQ